MKGTVLIAGVLWLDWCSVCRKTRQHTKDGCVRCSTRADLSVVPVRLCSTCFEWRTFLFTTGECGGCYCDRRWSEFAGASSCPSADRGRGEPASALSGRGRHAKDETR